MSAGGWEARQDTMPLSRFYAGLANPAFAITNGEVPQVLLGLPALLMPELDGQATRPQMARIVTINRARVSGKDIKIEYADIPHIPPIPFATIVKLAGELNISTEGFSLSHTHWTARDADLFKVLLQHKATDAPQPTVFSLDQGRDANLIGVMMPFDAGFSPVYEAIKVAAAASNASCSRADDMWLHPTIMQTIVSIICRSDIVVADCSGKNPNVFYEAGIAHTLGKDVILLAQNINDVPFDLRALSILLYLPNREGLAKLTADLTARITAVRAAR